MLHRTNWKIGLTGGIGCGKSTAARILEKMGFRRLDTDQVARQVVEPESEGLRRLVGLFGNSILQNDGRLDRAALGKRVFASESDRKALEALLHPLIWSEVQSFLAKAERDTANALVEVPLLFENRREEEFDQVWTVAASEKLQFQRLRERNGWSDPEIAARLASQMPLSKKRELADRVFENDGDLKSLEKQLAEALRELKQGKPKP